MNESIQQLGNSATRRSKNVAGGGGLVSPGLFVLFALELFLMGTVVWYYLVNSNSFPFSSASLTDIVWGLIAVATAGWGSWYLTMAHRATLQWNVSYSRHLLMIVVASGAILLGILLLNIASVFVSKPVYMDIRSQFASSRGDTKSAASAALVGDAANGKKWFGMSCFTCHGPTGDGVANAAPSLRASEFLKTVDELAVASLIRNGRTANDPANKTGKVMPAKGGNPFLDESKIADLVALLNDLDGQFGASSSVSGTSTVSTDSSSLPLESTAEPAVGNQMAAASAPQLNRWVVPVATAETTPSTWATSTLSASGTFSNSVLNRDSSRYATVRQSMPLFVRGCLSRRHRCWLCIFCGSLDWAVRWFCIRSCSCHLVRSSSGLESRWFCSGRSAWRG